MTKRRKQRIRETVMTSLAFARMQADLYAIEAAIRDNAIKAAEESESDTGAEKTPISVVRKFWSTLKTEINNSLKKISAPELEAKKGRAQAALTAFKEAHAEKDLALGNDPEALKEYIDKHLFKRDSDGRDRLTFALMYAIDDKHGYECPEESLEVVSEILFGNHKRLGVLYSQFRRNFVALNRICPSEFERGLLLGSLASGSPITAVVSGTVALMYYIVGGARAKASYDKLSAVEAYTSLAFGLTLIEATKDNVSADTLKAMVDEQLGHISSIRADAQYVWTVEGERISECRDKIEACDRAYTRLNEILGV